MFATLLAEHVSDAAAEWKPTRSAAGGGGPPQLPLARPLLGLSVPPSFLVLIGHAASLTPY